MYKNVVNNIDFPKFVKNVFLTFLEKLFPFWFQNFNKETKTLSNIFWLVILLENGKVEEQDVKVTYWDISIA